MLATDALRLRHLGQLADAYVSAERAYRLGNTAGTRFERQAVRVTLFELEHEDIFTGPVKPIAQDLAGKHREAIASIEEENGQLFARLLILSRQRRYQELLETVNVKTADVEQAVAGPGLQADIILAEIALAARRMGDDVSLHFAMRRLEQVANEPTINVVSPAEISWEILSGRHDAAMDLIEAMIESDFSFTLQLFLRPVFSLLEESPRFEALESRLKSHIDKEREKLNLAPVEFSTICIRDHCPDKALASPL
jgi:hypothetical protein